MFDIVLSFNLVSTFGMVKDPKNCHPITLKQPITLTACLQVKPTHVSTQPVLKRKTILSCFMG